MAVLVTRDQVIHNPSSNYDRVRRMSVTSWKSATSCLSFSSGSTSTLEDEIVTIGEVRNYVLTQMSKSPETYYESDFQKVSIDNWFIQRYIDDQECKPTVESVSKSILTMLAWKKEYGIMDPSKFSTHFFNSGIITYGRDPHDGQFYIYIRGPLLKAVPGWSDVFVAYICYIINITESWLSPGEKISVMVDCTGATTSTLDVSIVFKLLPIVLKYYPSALNQYILYDIPWFFRPLLSLCLKLVPTKYQKIVMLLHKKNIMDKFDPESLPYFMGGSIIPEIFPIPSGTSSIDEIALRRNISQSHVDKLHQYLSFLEDRKKRSNSISQ